jgi:DNA topoisomerase-3
MTKALIIAEKPSVAQDLVRALTPVAGKFEKHDEYFENETYLVTSAVGHLVEIKAPEAFDVKRGKWSFANLPVIPPHFDLIPLEKTKTRLNAIAKLIRRKDVSRLINACDAGREGELIFRLVAEYAKAKQPVERLWLQSMKKEDIQDGFKHLRSDQDMQALAHAARCRAEADWLVGINGTRAMTAFNSRDGGFFLTTVGRVQTPTLSVVVEREEKIRKFISRPYWEVRADFTAAAGTYKGKWFDPQWHKDEADPARTADRLWSQEQAQAIAQAVRGQSASVSEESTPRRQSAPRLFDLTSLQREANSRFGFSAKTTLSLAQSLYERHKVLTYPRTGSKALPENYLSVVDQTLQMLATEQGTQAFAPFAREALKGKYVKPNPRVFNDKEVSDHFAIIPTLEAPKTLNEIEAKLYDLVVRRFLAVFFPAAEFLDTTRITIAQGQHFKTEGKVLVKPGWLAIYGKDVKEEEDDAQLVAVGPNEKVSNHLIEVLSLQTKPPARYNEATLLSAMEKAGKDLEDDDLRDAMQEKGLGTPATRAAIIEGLLNEKYMLREGRDLLPTAKAFQLMTLLRGLNVVELTQPQLTGEWEHKLSEMEQGRMLPQAFMAEIAQMTQRIVQQAKDFSSDTIPGDYATLSHPCPSCGGIVKENYRRFACEKCSFSISKTPAGRAFETQEAEALLRDKHIGPLDGFRSKMGRPFSAELNLILTTDAETGEQNYKLDFDWGQDDEAANATPVDFSGHTPLGHCPKCQHQVFDHGLKYVCEKAVGPDKTCDFSSGKIILQQPIAPEQMEKLLSSGKTDLLTAFVSSRTRRPFKAFLAWDAKAGKVAFEFEVREPRTPAAKKAAAKRAAAQEQSALSDAPASSDTPVKAAAKKTAAKKVAAKKAPAKKAAAKKTAVKKPPAKKAASK